MRDPWSRRQPAFTLLELVIVLLVVVGLLAVVWPNLQKPLRRTTLDEAALMLRDAIDESRYQATLSGTPFFVLLRPGSNEIQTGTFESFLAIEGFDTLGSSSATGEATPGQVAPSQTDRAATQPAVRTWRLPETVVVSRVDWRSQQGRTPVNEVDETAANGFGISEERDLGSDLATTADNPPTSRGDALALEMTDRQWWLPLTATGQGRDATIELFDNSIQETLSVSYLSATGALEISR